jgi:hypothetical protein
MKEPEQSASPNDEMKSEYDFREGIRGKYSKHFPQASTVVVLDPDIAAEFKNSEAVNAALRALLKDRSEQ